MLQRALEAAGLREIEDANEVVREMLRGNMTDYIRRYLPEFDPEALTVDSTTGPVEANEAEVAAD